MKIIVSACLLGHNCKYNGGNNRNQDIIDFVRNHEVLSICPELLGGLSIPRQPAEIQNGIVTNCCWGIRRHPVSERGTSGLGNCHQRKSGTCHSPTEKSELRLQTNL